MKKGALELLLHKQSKKFFLHEKNFSFSYHDIFNHFLYLNSSKIFKILKIVENFIDDKKIHEK